MRQTTSLNLKSLPSLSLFLTFLPKLFSFYVFQQLSFGSPPQPAVFPLLLPTTRLIHLSDPLGTLSILPCVSSHFWSLCPIPKSSSCSLLSPIYTPSLPGHLHSARHTALLFSISISFS